MQNDMRTIHVGIFHLFQKKTNKKNMMGIKTLILQHLTTETLTLVANSTELQKSRYSEFLYHFSFQRSAKAQASLCIFRKFDLALQFEK